MAMTIFSGVRGCSLIHTPVASWIALTTYSSYAFETLKMYEQGTVELAILNILGNNIAALGAVVLGAVIARKI